MRTLSMILICLCSFYQSMADEYESFYKAWGLSYQLNQVKANNTMALYGGGGFFGPSQELRRGNANFSCSNLAFNIEEVSVNYYITAKTTILGLPGKDKDSTNYIGSQREKILLKAAYGFNIKKLGIQFGGSFVAGEKKMSRVQDDQLINNGGYFYQTNTNYGIQSWDRMNYIEWGLLIQAVFQFSEHNGIRASVSSGWIKNSRRNVKGTSTEREIRFYHSHPRGKRNSGFFIGYRYSQHLVDGQNESEIMNGNSGTRRFPAAVWKQRTFLFGLNIPIKFS